MIACLSVLRPHRNGGGLYCSKCAKAVAQEEETVRETEVSALSIAASVQASNALSMAEKQAVSIPEAAISSEVAQPAVPSCCPAVSSPSEGQEGSTPPNPNR